MKRITMIGLILLMTNALAVAQVEFEPNYEHLQFFEPYIGTWTRFGPAPDDKLSWPRRGK